MESSARVAHGQPLDCAPSPYRVPWPSPCTILCMVHPGHGQEGIQPLGYGRHHGTHPTICRWKCCRKTRPNYQTWSTTKKKFIWAMILIRLCRKKGTKRPESHLAGWPGLGSNRCGRRGPRREPLPPDNGGERPKHMLLDVRPKPVA
jgi:hypothetical protein